MTLQEAIKRAPAIAAQAPAVTVSPNYQFIPTDRIVEQLQRENGWEISSVCQQGSSLVGNHRVDFRLPMETDERLLVGQVVPTAYLINNHSGVRRMTFGVGLEVCICSNQARTPLQASETDHVHRGGDLNLDRLVSALLSGRNRLLGQVMHMRSTTLDEGRRIEFATRAIMAHESLPSPSWVKRADVEAVLTPLRPSQRGDGSLWTTYNVVQENLIERGRSGRGVHEILRNESLNHQLWELALAV